MTSNIDSFQIDHARKRSSPLCQTIVTKINIFEVFYVINSDDEEVQAEAAKLMATCGQATVCQKLLKRDNTYVRSLIDRDEKYLKFSDCLERFEIHV